MADIDNLRSDDRSDANADHAATIQKELSAAMRLPDQVPIRAAEISRRLLAEQRPKTELERILWQEVAHRASCLEFAESCEAALLRVGGRNAARIADATAAPENGDLPHEITADDYLTAVISSDYVDKLNRHRRQHQNGLNRALNVINSLAAKNEVQRIAKFELADIRRLFPDRVSCEQFLISQQDAEKWRCSHCGDGPKHFWLKGRRRWECGHCGAQHGHRQGTVAEHSPLPIEKWFWSILLVCSNLELSAARLSEAVEIARIATAKRMLAAILLALRSPNRDRLLMGLPQFLIKSTISPELDGDLGRIFSEADDRKSGVIESVAASISDVVSSSCND